MHKSQDMVSTPTLAETLDHAREFVDIVLAGAPHQYSELLKTSRFRSLLTEDNRFNHGKLYAWAEFLVFRTEFLRRFPGASRDTCVNTFSTLFLKNDISMSNLINLIEDDTSAETLLLQKRGSSD